MSKNKDGLSPMMMQYKKIKNTYPDSILMFRLGDFYEMFFEDAVTVSRELDLTLTGRACGLSERAPMCGVPHHSVQTYISRLLKKGYKVAICEQMQDPSTVAKGDIVDRNVTRIITGGTITDTESLSDDKNNYLMSLYLDDKGVGAVWTDITTSETYNHYIPYPVKVKLNDLLVRIKPAEIICNSKMLQESVELSAVKYGSVCNMTQYDDAMFEFECAKNVLVGIVGERELKEICKTPACVCAEGALISYVQSLHFRKDVNIGSAENFESDIYMDIDANTAKTLELVESQSKKRGTTLRDVINKTNTPMGDRLLQKWIVRPLCVKSKIEERLDSVNELYGDTITRERLRTSLSNIKDIVRISANLALGEIKTKDVLALGASFRALPDIKQSLGEVKSVLLKTVNNEIDTLSELATLIDNAIVADNPQNGKDGKDNEDSLIKTGFDSQLDEYRALVKNSREIIAGIEAQEREKTQIKNLRISYNRLFGYFIEVPRQFDSQVPEYYQRRQTVANAERYITNELKEWEFKVLNASELAEKRERELYLKVLATLRKDCEAITRTGKAIAVLDCIVSLSTVAKQNGYCRPEITENGEITISEGRHPVAELLPSDELFVPNNTQMNSADSKIMLITGPNMAGKSLYMRQVALITILAHIGSFVPAKSARIGLVDKVFTRVGASDDISTGRSTFMVEMSEVSLILDNATDSSLVLLDEIGRGTSTYDGLSIAWAVIEYIAQRLSAKVLFSTHFHELTELEGTITGLKNYKFTAKESEGGIKFIRKIMRGSANKSFGIEVSALAGLPTSVLDRAKHLLSQLVNADIAHKANDVSARQLSLFDNVSRYDEVIRILKELDVNDITPRAALDILCDLKEKTDK
ncbi:MAG: DNA mismatch repair protein MutS [Clostridiales bacterium]|nr:DNA mismatch repair protein MutS [Clostridiales bacterium]